MYENSLYNFIQKKNFSNSKISTQELNNYRAIDPINWFANKCKIKLIYMKIVCTILLFEKKIVFKFENIHAGIVE